MSEQSYVEKKFWEFYLKYKTKNEPIFVYFIESGDKIKIGKSLNPLRRINEIQNLIKKNVEIIGLTTKYNELEVHKMFKEDRLEGEWFSNTERLYNFIQTLKNETQECLKLAKKIRLTEIEKSKKFVSDSILTSEEIKLLIERGLELFIELKRIALEVNDPIIRSVLQKNPELVRVLDKWEKDIEIMYGDDETMNKEEWKEKWQYWLQLTKDALNRNPIHESEELYWKIIRSFGDFFDPELGYEGPNPQPIFAETYGVLFSSYFMKAPKYSWMLNKNRKLDVNLFKAIMLRKKESHSSEILDDSELLEFQNNQYLKTRGVKS